MSSRAPLHRGDVVLAHFPFTDLSGLKQRPVLVLALSGSDLVVAFITSRLSSAASPAHYLVAAPDPEAASTGLRAPSVVRLDRLATIERRLVVRRLGRIGMSTQRAVDEALRYVFQI